MKRINPVLFGLILLCAFLPFINISCAGEKVADISLFQLGTGSEVEQPNLGFGESSNTKTEKIDPEPLAIILLVITTLGLIFSFSQKKGPIFSIIFSLLGLLSLFLLKAKIDDEIDRSALQVIKIEYGIGYGAILLLFISICILSFYLLSLKPKEEVSGLGEGVPSKFCPHCGQKLTGNEIFCPNCGHELKSTNKNPIE